MSKDELRHFICENGLEHRIGQNAVDSGHGARPTGPQICLRCKVPLMELIDSYTKEAVRAARLDEAKLHQDWTLSPADHEFTHYKKLLYERVDELKQETGGE